jgi:hypothetical protein
MYKIYTKLGHTARAAITSIASNIMSETVYVLNGS